MFGIRKTALMIGTAALGFGAASDAAAYVFYMAGDNPLRWYVGRPAYNWTMATVEPEEATWEEAKAIIEAAYDAWIDTPCGLVPEFTYGGTSAATKGTLPTSLAETPDNVVVFIRSRTDWQSSGNQSSWLAITKIANDSLSGEIIDADMEINDGMYKFHYGEEAPPAGSIDFRAMIVHEAGHFFGLDHSQSNVATMYATYSGDPVAARSLDQDDIDGICALYTDVPTWVDRTVKPEPPDDGGGGGCGAGGAVPGLLAGLGVVLGLRRRRR
jgi:hypothetical protein